MKQLKMYRMPDAPFECKELPPGYTISNYSCVGDGRAWYECCRNGRLLPDENDTEAFEKIILSDANIDPFKDVFFLDYGGEHVATVTAFVHPEDNTGDMHMVSIREDFRRKGLSKYLNQITINHLTQKNVKFIHLTTDDFRLAAIKSYLSAGFLPVNYDTDMEERWSKVLKSLNITDVKML